MVARQPDPKKTGLKIASIIMALLLWFYILNQGDVPIGGKKVQVDLQYNNVAAELHAKGPTSVTVTMWGSLHGTAEIQAYVDLSGLGKGAHQVPVKLKTIQGTMF